MRWTNKGYDIHNSVMYCLLIEDSLPRKYVQKISEKNLNTIKKYRYIIIYGAGNYATDIYILLKKQFVDIMGFAVTKYDNNVSTIDEKPIMAIEDWLEYKKE